MNRRDAAKIIAALPFIGCDTSKPNRGPLHVVERVNKKVESFLMTDYEPEAGDITPPMAFPAYHVAPAVPIMPKDWSLQVSGMVGRPLRLSMEDILKMPSKTIRITHYCVEGWSATAEWTGVPLSHIAERAGAKDVDYVEFRSFDVPRNATRGYWSSWDRDSAMHPQTILAYGMNGKLLHPMYGAPLRLYGAIKLGYKNVKYLTEVNFLERQTGGYWEDAGYEWFAGV
jgi:DMSO/TMAO reductase YedYZ molybdopterin-dependent catalytic subunit